MLIYGPSLVGKTMFLNRLQEIFPCEEYPSRSNLKFNGRSDDSANYDHILYNPSFILNDNSSLDIMLDPEDIEQTLDMLKGRGKIL